LKIELNKKQEQQTNSKMMTSTMEKKETTEYMDDYERQKTRVLEYVIANVPDNKHTIITQLLNKQVIQEKHLKPYLAKIHSWDADSDFLMIVLLRIMYLAPQDKFTDPSFNLEYTKLYDNMYKAIEAYPFWPPKKEFHDKDVSRIIFWSENHLLMTLSSAYLFLQLQARTAKGDTSFEFENCLECKLLLKYLEIHCHPLFESGIYEVNSHVYLPFSMNSLWNLYDFAENPVVKERAECILNRIVYLLMLGVDPATGVGNLTATARAYSRTRLRNFGHNINSFITLMNGGKNIDNLINPEVTALTDFFLTTNWRPKPAAFEAVHFSGSLTQVPISHELAAFSQIYGKEVLAEHEHTLTEVDDWTPLYWSAGIIAHPMMAAKTRYFQRHSNLTNNKHLWPINRFFMTNGGFAKNMQSFEHFAKGGMYLGFKLNLYKRPDHGLVVSSFHCWNAHHCGFQQIPWMANISGAPLWSQSGLGSESVGGFEIFNTHNPAVQQNAETMLITYLTPHALKTVFMRNIFSSKVRFFWPIPLFDKHWVKEYGKKFEEPSRILKEKKGYLSFLGGGQHPHRSNIPNYPSEAEQLLLRAEECRSWCIGQRGNVYVAVMCTKPIVLDDKSTLDAVFQEMTIGEDNKYKKKNIVLPRLYCEARYHSWVLVFGTTTEYDSVEKFVDEKLMKIDVVEKEINDGTNKIYKIDVKEGESEKKLSYQYDRKKSMQIINE
jgi:hypothetical protein